MAEPTRHAAQVPRRSRRRLVVATLALLVLAVVASGVAFITYQRQQATQTLERAVAEADRLDPGWRLEQIEKRRLAVPIDDNAAPPIARASDSLADGWSNFAEVEDIERQPPQCQIDAVSLAALERVIKPLRPLVLPYATQAMQRKKGGFVIEWTPIFWNTPTPHLGQIQRVGSFLLLDAILRNQTGDPAGAWEAGLNILAVARALGEEPLSESQLVRVRLGAQAVRTLERTLAQGVVEEAKLAEAQKSLVEESTVPVLLFALRGQRACVYLLLDNMEAGTVDADKIIAGLREDGAAGASHSLFSGNTYKLDQAWLLDAMTKAVEIAKGPPHEVPKKLAALDAQRATAPPVAGLLWVNPEKAANLFMRGRVLLDCAVVGIAVERFRLAYKRWPDSLDEVIAANLLTAIPLDKFDGKPLRMRQTPDGMVVYSVGPDGNYLGEMLDADTQMDPNVHRYEFRLWDTDNRRQMPRPLLPRVDGKK